VGQKATAEEISFVEQILPEVFSNANVGLGILDDQLRYVALNTSLALIHGLSAESHLGKSVREILGNLALLVEPVYKQVLVTGQPILNIEFEGERPTRMGTGRWIANYFPVKDAAGKVTQICAVVAEVPENEEREGVQPSASEQPANAVLRSWKEIAEYTGTCTKTVQRWERSYGFPVRRLKASKGSLVFALTGEVETWLRKKSQVGRQ
jgi:PAS domain S-box-containing protein